MHIAPPAPASALTGLAAARDRMDSAAHNLANASTDPFSPRRPDGTHGAPGTLDAALEIVGTMQATVLYGANLRVIRAEDEMRASVVDVLA